MKEVVRTENDVAGSPVEPRVFNLIEQGLSWKGTRGV